MNGQKPMKKFRLSVTTSSIMTTSHWKSRLVKTILCPVRTSNQSPKQPSHSPFRRICLRTLSMSTRNSARQRPHSSTWITEDYSLTLTLHGMEPTFWVTTDGTTDLFRLMTHHSKANICSLVTRSEEHTSELQSRQYLVCRLLLEKKKTYTTSRSSSHHTTLYTSMRALPLQDAPLDPSSNARPDGL